MNTGASRPWPDLCQITAHGYALAVTDGHGVRPKDLIFAIVPAAKKADCYPRARRRVDFLLLHRIIESLAGILAGPGRRKPGADRFVGVTRQAVVARQRSDDEVLPAIGSRFQVRRLAKEVLFPGASQRCVCVGASDHAEFVRVNAERLLRAACRSVMRSGHIHTAASNLLWP